MPSVAASRSVAAPLGDMWDLVCDPYHLPRWWPRVERVEDVREDAFTEVMRTKGGKVVRADFTIEERDDVQHTLRWRQELQGTPFAAALGSSQTVIRLAEASMRTEVTIELHQTVGSLRSGSRSGQGGWFAFGPPKLGMGPAAIVLRRAAARTVREALDGLERIGA